MTGHIDDHVKDPRILESSNPEIPVRWAHSCRRESPRSVSIQGETGGQCCQPVPEKSAKLPLKIRQNPPNILPTRSREIRKLLLKNLAKIPPKIRQIFYSKSSKIRQISLKIYQNPPKWVFQKSAKKSAIRQAIIFSAIKSENPPDLAENPPSWQHWAWTRKLLTGSRYMYQFTISL